MWSGRPFGTHGHPHTVVNERLHRHKFGTYITYAKNRDKRVGHLDRETWQGTIDPNWRMILGVRSTGFYAPYPDRPSKDVMDRYIDAQMVEIDEPKCLSILKKIHALDREDPLSIPLFGLKMS